MAEWLKTADAADHAGVGITTIKRWADEGRLACMKTPGGHRRYRRADLDRILDSNTDDHAAEEWLELMLHAPGYELEARLTVARAELGSWWRVMAEVGKATQLLGMPLGGGQHLGRNRAQCVGEAASRTDEPQRSNLVQSEGCRAARHGAR